MSREWNLHFVKVGISLPDMQLPGGSGSNDKEVRDTLETTGVAMVGLLLKEE